MKNTVKNSFYAGSAIALISLNNIVSALDVGLKTTKADNGAGNDFMTTLDNMFGYLLTFLYFIAVVFAVYGWFQILTAGWDDAAVKKWKTTLINAVIGLVVIFLSSIIIRWVIDLATGTNAVIK